MTISREEALELLRKWANESILVLAFVEAAGIVLRLIGSISLHDCDAFLVYQEGPQLRRTEVAFGLDKATRFTYSEIREAPEAVKSDMGDWMTSALAFDLPIAKVRVYELATPASGDPART